MKKFPLRKRGIKKCVLTCKIMATHDNTLHQHQQSSGYQASLKHVQNLSP